MSSPSSAEPVRIGLLGSTGSIGRQALEVIERDPGFRVVALAAGSNAALLAEQAARHGSATTALGSEAALVEIAERPDVDLLLVATGGVVGLRAILAALRRGAVVATANKETLVAAGHLVMPLARALAASPGSGGAASPLAWLRPIDSEHSAIWQCLAGERLGSVARLVLTASGGPFLDRPAATFDAITPDDALRHPTWTMGAKITIDSATLANKGLEVIEAHWLYDVPYDAIDVVIHPQSIVHSAVLFADGSLKAQLGTPDMRLPIQYALTFPDRRPSPVTPPDLLAAARLDFREPDLTRFPAIRIAREAGAAGPRATAALIAADDIAVERFLAGSLSFTGISTLLEAAIDRAIADGGSTAPALDELLALDADVRAWARAASGAPATTVAMSGGPAA
jgi:1-deoxy-D-xylulose-5-phosphate reductoisomerase